MRSLAAGLANEARLTAKDRAARRNQTTARYCRAGQKVEGGAHSPSGSGRGPAEGPAQRAGIISYGASRGISPALTCVLTARRQALPEEAATAYPLTHMIRVPKSSDGRKNAPVTVNMSFAVTSCGAAFPMQLLQAQVRRVQGKHS